MGRAVESSTNTKLVITKKKNTKVQVVAYTERAKEKLKLKYRNNRYYTIENLELEAVHKNPESTINFLLEMDKKLQQ